MESTQQAHPQISTSLPQSSSLAQYTPAQIEAAKAQLMARAVKARPQSAPIQVDRWVAIALISGVSFTLTAIGISYTIATSTPTAATERMLVSQMNMIEAQNAELQKPRIICIFDCPDSLAASTPAEQASAPVAPAEPYEGEWRKFNIEGQWITAEYRDGQWFQVGEGY